MRLGERGALARVDASRHRDGRDVHDLFDDVRYWATANVEVDFLLCRGKESIALEAKASRRTVPANFSGLRSVGELQGVVRRVLVYSGNDERITPDDGIEVWPVRTLVERLASHTLWP